MQQMMKQVMAMRDTHQSKRKIDHVERGSGKSNSQSFHLSLGKGSRLNDYWSVFIPSVDRLLQNWHCSLPAGSDRYLKQFYFSISHSKTNPYNISPTSSTTPSSSTRSKLSPKEEAAAEEEDEKGEIEGISRRARLKV